MKTTLDIPEGLLRRIKARAAQKGSSMREFVVEAVEEKLMAESARGAGVRGWRRAFGKAPAGSTREVQEVLDGAFESVDPEEWR
jgi:hypothetical protein